MKKRYKRPTVYSCVALDNKKVISKIIEASSDQEASELFYNEYLITPLSITGPFYKKRDKKLPTEIVFSNITKNAIYEGWNVNAVMLKVPENFAYLFFNNRLDGRRISKPEINIVKIEELEFKNEK